MNEFRLGRLGSWIVLGVVGLVWGYYFLDATRYPALTQTAGWFLRSIRFLSGG